MATILSVAGTLITAPWLLEELDEQRRRPGYQLGADLARRPAMTAARRRGAGLPPIGEA